MQKQKMFQWKQISFLWLKDLHLVFFFQISRYMNVDCFNLKKKNIHNQIRYVLIFGFFWTLDRTLFSCVLITCIQLSSKVFFHFFQK